MAQFLWSGIWQYVENVHIYLLFEYAILLVGISLREGKRKRERVRERREETTEEILLEVVCWWSNREWERLSSRNLMMRKKRKSSSFGGKGETVSR